ncbi:phage tail protein [Verrucomicrobiota bacterium sgz303538]
MSDPFVAEIRIFPFNFPPKGWAFCNGQILPLSQNTALFSLLGTVYGGDGKSNFALPNILDNAVMQPGQGPGLSQRFLGETGGTETVTLLESEIPAHTHALQASRRVGDAGTPSTALLPAATQSANIYAAPGGATNAMAFQSLAPAGGSLPHNNMQPYLTLNYCIALQGVYPPRT